MNCFRILRSISRLGVSQYQYGVRANPVLSRNISTGLVRNCSSTDQDGDEETEAEKTPRKKVNPAKDRSKVIPYDTSIKYMESDAYKATYGDELVWKLYRRNHKYQRPRVLTRRSCIAHNVITVGSPCPICRDEYLVLDHRNIKLLKQFISPQTEDVIEATFTGNFN
ncbi:Mitochondrial ribosomal protein S18B [Chamberlinius hualienensis]